MVGTAEGEDGSATIDFHQVIMFQGEDPTTTEIERTDAVWVVHKTAWSVPHDVDTLYAYVPDGARNVTIEQMESISHQGTSIFSPGKYSVQQNPDNPPTVELVEDGELAGMYSWSFPSGIDRMSHASVPFSSQEEMEDFDPELTNASEWTIFNGTVGLAPDIGSATYTSKRYIAGTDVLSVNITYLASGAEGNMTFEVTKDNGTTWIPIQNATLTPLDGAGSKLRWRVSMIQDPSLNNTPVLEYLVLAVDFIEEVETIWIQAEYWLEIPTKGLEFDIFLPLDSNETGFVLLAYADPELVFSLEGADVTKDPSETYPGKLSYLHMTGDYEKTLTFTLKIEKPTSPSNEGANVLLFMIPIVLAILIGIVYLKSRTPQSVMDSERAPRDIKEGERVVAAKGAADAREGLMVEKAELMAAIKALDFELEKSMIGPEEHEIRREMIMVKTVDVMRRLDEIGED
jgi:hypothetical protein